MKNLCIHFYFERKGKCMRSFLYLSKEKLIKYMRNKVIVLSTLACMFGTEGSKAQCGFDNQAELAAARMGVERAARVSCKSGTYACCSLRCTCVNE